MEVEKNPSGMSLEGAQELISEVAAEAMLEETKKKLEITASEREMKNLKKENRFVDNVMTYKYDPFAEILETSNQKWIAASHQQSEQFPPISFPEAKVAAHNLSLELGEIQEGTAEEMVVKMIPTLLALGNAVNCLFDSENELSSYPEEGPSSNIHAYFRQMKSLKERKQKLRAQIREEEMKLNALKNEGAVLHKRHLERVMVREVIEESLLSTNKKQKCS